MVNVIQKLPSIKNIDILQERLEFIQQFLSDRIGKPVNLKIRVFPIEIIDYEVAAPKIRN